MLIRSVPFPGKKIARHNWVFVLTDLVVSETECMLCLDFTAVSQLRIKH